MAVRLKKTVLIVCSQCIFIYTVPHVSTQPQLPKVKEQNVKCSRRLRVKNSLNLEFMPEKKVFWLEKKEPVSPQSIIVGCWAALMFPLCRFLCSSAVAQWSAGGSDEAPAPLTCSGCLSPSLWRWTLRRVSVHDRSAIKTINLTLTLNKRNVRSSLPVEGATCLYFGALHNFSNLLLLLSQLILKQLHD